MPENSTQSADAGDEQESVAEEQNPSKTPLEAVKEQQAMAQENRDVARQPDTSPEVPGASIPSDRRHHPQRQMYGSGTGVDET
jgi:hypothetical protein